MSQIETLAQSGYEPSEAIATVLARDNLPGGAFGPTMRRGMDDVADIGRALKAGHRNPTEVSKFLCPFGVEDLDADCECGDCQPDRLESRTASRCTD